MAIDKSKNQDDIAVVVFANRKDFFLTKLCVSSIRYYYPNVEIFMVKDQLNGNFNTKRFCNAFKVELIDLGRKFYGWSAAKVFFNLSNKLPKRRYLTLDSDIIFVGRVLDKLNRETGNYVVHPEVYPQPFTDMVKKVFLDPEKIVQHFKEYEYPGFFFNAGQIVVTPGIITPELIAPAFTPKAYPFYKDVETFPLVDQSILNISLAILSKHKKATVSKVPFMLWSVDFFADPSNNEFKKFADGSFEFLVHYAGDTRVPQLEKMKGYELLKFFRDRYDARLSKFDLAADRMQDKLADQSKLVKMVFKKNRVLIELRNRFKKLLNNKN